MNIASELCCGPRASSLATSCCTTDNSSWIRIEWRWFPPLCAQKPLLGAQIIPWLRTPLSTWYLAQQPRHSESFNESGGAFGSALSTVRFSSLNGRFSWNGQPIATPTYQPIVELAARYISERSVIPRRDRESAGVVYTNNQKSINILS